jgi:hypothetical protein
MTSLSLVVLLLGVMSLCLIGMTATLVRLTCDVRRTLRRVDLVLPEARRSLQHVRRLLTRTSRATQHVEAVIHAACDTVSGALGRVGLWKDQVQAAVSRYVGNAGNGAGAGPRRHHRRG